MSGGDWKDMLLDHGADPTLISVADQLTPLLAAQRSALPDIDQARLGAGLHPESWTYGCQSWTGSRPPVMKDQAPRFLAPVVRTVASGDGIVSSRATARLLQELRATGRRFKPTTDGADGSRGGGRTTVGTWAGLVRPGES